MRVDDALVVNLDVPGVARTGALQDIVVTYTNTSDQPIPAPLLDITSSDTALAVAGSTNFVEHDLMVLAIDQSGPAGILPAGYIGQITIVGRPDVDVAHEVNDYTASVVDTYQLVDTTQGGLDNLGGPIFVYSAVNAEDTALDVSQPVPIDWPTVLAPSEPPGMSTAGWDLVVDNLEANVGTTFPSSRRPWTRMLPT